MTSVAVPSPVPSPVPRASTIASRPLRAATSALVMGACTSVVAVVLAHRFGALHLPVYGLWLGSERLGDLVSVAITVFGAALLSLFVPLTIAARKVMLGRRASLYLFAAAVGPVIVAFMGAFLFLPFHTPLCHCMN